MSHHYSGPDLGFPRGDARLDLTDLYAFPKPGDAGKSILIMNVLHPSAGREIRRDPLPPSLSRPRRFTSSRLTRTAMPWPTSRTGCASRPPRAGRRPRRCAALRARRPPGRTTAARAIVEGAPVSTGREARVTHAGDYRFFAGRRSDPFFFDVAGAVNNLQFTGDDFFADKDVCSIVLEVPNSALGAQSSWPVGPHAGPGDRHGRGLGPGGSRRAAPTTPCPRSPASRELPTSQGSRRTISGFVAVFAHALEHTGGYTPQEAKRVAGTMLPEILPYDPTRPASFPENGRALTDDAADAFLSILTNGKVTQDKVGPHGDLLAEFPYLGPPHNA